MQAVDGWMRPDSGDERRARPRLARLPPRERVARIRYGKSVYTKKGIGRFDLRDPYHVAVTLTWPQFFAALLGLYLGVNLIFATLYTLVPGSIANAHPYSFVDAFYFSFETLATVGYGEMFPASAYGHIVACAEIVCGLSFTAILTGLTFVRFSRPRAKFLFADRPVVTMHNGVPTLMLRVANGRAAVLTDARVKLNALLSYRTPEGGRFRSAQELRLTRAHVPIFPLTWTLFHPLDAASPLRGLDPAKALELDSRLYVSLTAYDPHLATTVQDVRDYDPADILFGMRYSDVVFAAEDGTPVADLTRISAVEPDLGAAPPESGWTETEAIEEA